MKSKYLLLTLSAGVALGLSSCEDLDTYPMGSTITSEQKNEVVESLPERAEAGVTSIFAQFTQYAPNYDAFGGVRHNDLGYPTVMMSTDANGADVVMVGNGYNWAGSSLDYSDRSMTSLECQMVWNDMYKIIFNANNLLGSLGEPGEDPNLLFYKAQALSGRAFSYWVLAQLFQFNYKGNEDKPCVPVITEVNAAEASLNGAKRASVKEVYAQIKSDLDLAIDYLSKTDVSRRDRRYVDLATAYGLRARMNLSMHNYAEAAADATNAIEKSDARPFSLDEAGLPAFWSVDEPNWMWGIVVAETDDVVMSGIVNWISHNGTFNYGYCMYSGGHQINKSLYNSIPQSDVRKSWWSDAEGNNARLTPAYQNVLKSFAPYTSCKFAPYKGYSDANIGIDINANDMPLMRIEEMYYIKAEGEAMSTGNTATLVDFVKKYRNPEYAISEANIQDEIYNQKRVEFWGEGLIWFDTMRLNKGVDRRGAGYAEPIFVYDIKPGDPLLLWPVPEAEIQANPSLSDADNNPSAPTPQPVPDIE